jgi:hypothetical protein
MDKSILFCVNRIRAVFRDHIGNSKAISGTGFWVEVGTHRHFVTNRHNVDPTLRLGAETLFRLNEVSIELRVEEPPGTLHEVTRFAEVDNWAQALRVHETADVAVLLSPVFASGAPTGIRQFTSSLLATNNLFKNTLQVTDAASFIGFPGRSGEQWWDERWNLPISRSVHLASWPEQPFTNRLIKTSDTHLVTGFSFSGSSGSPVLCHERGIQITGAVTARSSNYCAPHIVGIMSGHWEEPGLNNMFHHSGLSYLTRSTSIRELLQIPPELETLAIENR